MARTLVTLAACTLLVVGASESAAQSLATTAERQQAFTHYRAGQEYLASERWEKAAEEFRDAIQYELLFTDAHYGLGQSYMGLRRYVSAIQAFGRYIEAARQMHGLRARDRVSGDRAIDDEIRELREEMRRRRGQVLKTMQIEQRIVEVERSRSSLTAAFARGRDRAPQTPSAPASACILSSRPTSGR